MLNLGTLAKNSIFKLFYFFIHGEKGDLEAVSGKKKKYTDAQARRLELSRKLITRTNLWLLGISRGHLGNSFMGRPVALLTTIGRKSGKPRTQPVFFMGDGERIVLVASNAGSPDDPAWLLNAKVTPTVSISVRRNSRQMKLRIADADEEADLWPKLLDMFPGWQEGIDCCVRKIPVVLLEPCK